MPGIVKLATSGGFPKCENFSGFGYRPSPPVHRTDQWKLQGKSANFADFKIAGPVNLRRVAARRHASLHVFLKYCARADDRRSVASHGALHGHVDGGGIV